MVEEEFVLYRLTFLHFCSRQSYINESVLINQQLQKSKLRFPQSFHSRGYNMLFLSSFKEQMVLYWSNIRRCQYYLAVACEQAR